MDGGHVASRLADALYTLGFPWTKIGDEGLQIIERFSSPEADAEPDDEMLSEMREYFEGVKKSPPDIEPLTFETWFDPSEYTAVDNLISSLEDLAGNLPWAAEPANEILDDYEKYLKSVKAPKRLLERLCRIQHSVSDLEDRASGRA